MSRCARISQSTKVFHTTSCIQRAGWNCRSSTSAKTGSTTTIAELRRHVFTPESGPLIKATLLALSADAHVLVVLVHHIVSDHASLGILFEDLLVAYRARLEGEAPRWAALPAQFADYALWQRQAFGADSEWGPGPVDVLARCAGGSARRDLGRSGPFAPAGHREGRGGGEFHGLGHPPGRPHTARRANRCHRVHGLSGGSGGTAAQARRRRGHSDRQPGRVLESTRPPTT